MPPFDRDRPPEEGEPLRDATEDPGTSRKRLSLFQTTCAVLAALFGVRSSAGFRRDLTHGRAGDFILAGIVLVGTFVAVLWACVHFLIAYLQHHPGV